MPHVLLLQTNTLCIRVYRHTSLEAVTLNCTVTLSRSPSCFRLHINCRKHSKYFWAVFPRLWQSGEDVSDDTLRRHDVALTVQQSYIVLHHPVLAKGEASFRVFCNSFAPLLLHGVTATFQDAAEPNPYHCSQKLFSRADRTSGWRNVWAESDESNACGNILFFFFFTETLLLLQERVRHQRPELYVHSGEDQGSTLSRRYAAK